LSRWSSLSRRSASCRRESCDKRRISATRSPPQRPPRELLFEFYANKKLFRAELLHRGKWGVEAQIIEAPDDLRIGHRFDIAIKPLPGQSRCARTWSPGDLGRRRLDVAH
jgi:hypothetical protein